MSAPAGPRVRVRRLQHLQQRSNWDCGVSCVAMVLPDRPRQALLQGWADICREERFGQSTWTIDLCYLLKRFDLPFLYTTITLGVDPGYSSQTFYNKILAHDSLRVNERFKRAPELGLRVEERSCPLSELLNHLASQGPCIVLTNANALLCDVSHRSCLSSAGGQLSQCWGRYCLGSSYMGHYIVLVGYDLDRERVFYRNPAVRDRVCEMSFQCLEEARTAYGTDEDVIFVFRDDDDADDADDADAAVSDADEEKPAAATAGRS